MTTPWRALSGSTAYSPGQTILFGFNVPPAQAPWIPNPSAFDGVLDWFLKPATRQILQDLGRSQQIGETSVRNEGYVARRDFSMKCFREYIVTRRFEAARQRLAGVVAIVLTSFLVIKTAHAQKPERPRPSFDTWLVHYARFVYVATPIRLWNRVQRASTRELELVPYDQKVIAPDLLFSPISPYLEVEVREVICAGPDVDVKGMPKRLFVFMDGFGSETDLGVATNRLLGQGDLVFMTSGRLGWSHLKNISSVSGSVGKLAGSGVGSGEWSERTWPALPVAEFDAFRARLAKSKTCLPF